MDYGSSDGSGTDDDFPPHQNHGARGEQVGGKRRALVGEAPCSIMQSDMKRQIHRLEQEAYTAILMAFKAQSDAITWEKESLITELRRELRVSDDEHRRLLSQVNAEDIIRKIREWRQGGEAHPVSTIALPVNNAVPSQSISVSRKRQKISQSIPSLNRRASVPELHSQATAASKQLSSGKQGNIAGVKGNKMKPYRNSNHVTRDQATNRNLYVGPAAIEHGEAPSPQSLVGRKVLTKWPDDNNFYEAEIAAYNPANGKHKLIYAIHTDDESFEWVNLKEFAPEDIRWVGKEIGVADRCAESGAVNCNKYPKHQHQSTKDFVVPSQNGYGAKGSDYIEILHTETLLKEMERVYDVIHPNPLETEKAKKLLKEHEQSLINAIARLADTLGAESDYDDKFSQ